MRLAAIGIVLMGLTGAGVWLYPREAQCAFCPSIGCVDRSVCGKGCVCLKTGTEVYGQCVSIE